MRLLALAWIVLPFAFAHTMRRDEPFATTCAAIGGGVVLLVASLLGAVTLLTAANAVGERRRRWLAVAGVLALVCAAAIALAWSVPGIRCETG